MIENIILEKIFKNVCYSEYLPKDITEPKSRNMSVLTQYLKYQIIMVARCDLNKLRLKKKSLLVVLRSTTQGNIKMSECFLFH